MGLFIGVGQRGGVKAEGGGGGSVLTNSWHFMLHQLVSFISTTHS